MSNNVRSPINLLLPNAPLTAEGRALKILQQQLEGLQKGERAMVYLPAANSKLADDFSFDVVVDDVREALKEELLLGYPVQHATQHCPDDCICYMEQTT